MNDAFQLFRNDREALFVSRPNRFLVAAEYGGREILCHCPNPGRMAEILLPGAPLILERRSEAGGGGAGGSAGPRTAWTLAAARYRDGIVPLHTGRAAAAAGRLVLPRLFPGPRTVQAEYAIGGSRFDFRVGYAAGGNHLVEVKSCSLVERGVAMFPDAPSLRALRHLDGLAALSRKGWETHIVFLVTHGNPEVFIPNLHTDPALAAALSRHAGRVRYHAALVQAEEDGSARYVRDLPVDLSHGELASADSGSYLILLELPRPARIEVGALGEIDFPPGWYVYAGSARRGLAARTARHLRRTRKTRHWHLDYLTPHAGSAAAFPIASYRNLECRLAAALGKIGGRPVPHFGSSDCGCGSHLYRFTSPPREDRAFIELMLDFRHTEALRRE